MVKVAENKINFSHIIITRFNVKPPDEEMSFDKNKRSVLTREWLDERFLLFEKYYLPSLSAQTNKNFKCLIYFDTDTPRDLKARIEQLGKRYNFLVPKYVANYRLMGECVSEDVLVLCSADARFVITTRIDNDDCYHREAVAKIQESFVPVDKQGLSFYKGYRLLTEPGYLLLKNRFINSPFISLIEEIKPGQKINTAMNIMHHTFYADFSTIQIKNKYYWIQVIHGSNLVNDASGIPVMNKKILREFGLDDEKFNFSSELFVKYWIKFILNPKNFMPFKIKIFLLKILKKSN